MVNRCLRWRNCVWKRGILYRRRSYLRGQALASIAVAQFAARDVEGARATAREILTLGPPVDIEEDYNATTVIDNDTAVTANKVLGNYAAALELAGKMKSSPYKIDDPYVTLGDMCYWQAVQGGDIKGATRTAGNLAQRYAKVEESPAIIYGSLAAAQMKLGRVQDAIATIKIPKNRRDRIYWRVAGFVKDLVESGQIERAVEMLEVIRGEQGEVHIKRI